MKNTRTELGLDALEMINGGDWTLIAWPKNQWDTTRYTFRNDKTGARHWCLNTHDAYKFCVTQMSYGESIRTYGLFTKWMWIEEGRA